MFARGTQVWQRPIVENIKRFVSIIGQFTNYYFTINAMIKTKQAVQ